MAPETGPDTPARVIIVMGVSGAGKTTVGRRLADAIGARFVEGDTYHPASNVAKMTAGEALDDGDRAPWLATLSDAIGQWLAVCETVVLACSALKDDYRRRLVDGRNGIRFIHLAGDKDIITERLAGRIGHFMPPSLLDSQLNDLQPPPDAVVLNIAHEPDQLVAMALEQLGRSNG